MRPANSSYDAAVNRSLEQARDLLKQYKPGEIIPYEILDEKSDDLGFNEVIRPTTTEEPGVGFKVIASETGELKKYWTDGRGEIGAWPVNTPDEQILDELLEQCTSDEQRQNIRAGEIVTGEWTEQ